MSAALLALSAARPGAAWALLAPLLFLALQRLFERPPEVVIGTLELWRAERETRPEGARARGRIPAWALCVALALLCAALAWLGPRGARTQEAQPWTVLVDRSPSMGLPLDDTSRLDFALAAAEDWLAAHAQAADRVRWLAREQKPLELARGQRPDADWLRVDATSCAGAGEPDWAAHDQPGTLWVSDHAPAVARAHAGLFASGGPAVPGAIGGDGRERVLWDGSRLVRTPVETAPAVVLDERAGAAPLVLARAVQAWCAARGYAPVPAATATPDMDVVLTLAVVRGAGADLAVVLERDGWSARGTSAGRGVPASESGEDWLTGQPTDQLTDQGAALAAPVLVRARPGRVAVALRTLAEPEGDPARFALSFGRLFDGNALAPRGVVALAEREDAGAPMRAGGEAPLEPAEEHDSGPFVDAGLALAAALSAALGLTLLARPAAARAA